MSIEKLLLFILACLLEALVPENNFFMITAQSLKYGYRSTIWGILGVASAQVLLLLLFAFSFNLLQSKFHSFYNFIRITGSIYIIILGIEIFYEFFRSRKTTTIKPARKGELFIQGFSSHISNPKAVLLWTALIPQVLPTYTVSIFYPLLLGTISIFTEFCILNSYAWLAHTGGNFLANTRMSAVREFISGSFFLCLGTYLLLLSLRF
jgi:homoserine/homoserine lactone efflux protein